MVHTSSEETDITDNGLDTEELTLDDVDLYIGVKGADGDSAYDIAVKHGFVGTEEEWLKSLVDSTGVVQEYIEKFEEISAQATASIDTTNANVQKSNEYLTEVQIKVTEMNDLTTKFGDVTGLKNEVEQYNALFNDKLDNANESIEEINEALATKVGADEVNAYVDSKMSEYYTKEEVNALVKSAVKSKANADEVYTQTETESLINAKLAAKADTSDVYTRTEVDTLVAKKTKEVVNKMLEDYGLIP